MGNVERLPVRHTGRVAVLLNANARAVSDSLRRQLEAFVPAEDLFYSRCFEDARAISRQVLDRGYSTVLTGGGDGTFVGYVNCLFAEALSRPIAQAQGAFKVVPATAHSIRLPRFGVLKLGTGNAMAEFTGASARRVGVVEDILRACSGEASGSRPLHLLSFEGKRAPFAGLGIDAAIVNDYMDVKGNARLWSSGGMGYFRSVVGRTIPEYLFSRGSPGVEVINLGGPARQIGPDGKPVGREIEHGEIIYKGPCRIAAAGTVPYYGFGFQMFPFALQAPGKFQLRLTAISVPKIIANLRSLWRGGPPPSGVFDFLCDKALIRFDREMPLQVGGDAEGHRREVTFEMAERPVELLDFHAPRPG